MWKRPNTHHFPAPSSKQDNQSIVQMKCSVKRCYWVCPSSKGLKFGDVFGQLSYHVPKILITNYRPGKLFLLQLWHCLPRVFSRPAVPTAFHFHKHIHTSRRLDSREWSSILQMIVSDCYWLKQLPNQSWMFETQSKRFTHVCMGTTWWHSSLY